MEMILQSIDFAENRPSDGYSVGGELYFSVGDGYFPAEHWYDCAYLDLKTWLPRLISFGRNHTDSCELSFMDGPCTIRLDRRENGIICADFFRNHKCIGSERNVELQSVLQSALSACRKYDRFLHENGKINAFHEEIIIIMKLLDT